MAGLFSVSAFAQAPLTAPILPTEPSSARVAALGGAWVAGRDQDVVFTNPAQLIGTRTDAGLSLMREGRYTHGLSLASAYAAGKMSFTLGWGFQLAHYTFDPLMRRSPYPLVIPEQDLDAQSSLAAVAGAIVYKGFRMGAAGKYAADQTSASHHALLLDLGVSHSLLGGVGAIAGQNLGRDRIGRKALSAIPRQVAFGWSRTKPAGPLDLALFTQVTKRSGWTSPAAGLEAAYSWIEGYSMTLRAGVRRPESTSERPVALGWAFAADRLTVEYAVRFFDTGEHAHWVTLRWR
jgi:hypothetical protein